MLRSQDLICFANRHRDIFKLPGRVVVSLHPLNVKLLLSGGITVFTVRVVDVDEA